MYIIDFYFLFIYLFFVFLLFLWAAPAAYGGSQARGLIRAVATGLRQSHSNAGSEPICNLHHSSRQHRILNPLSKARDWTLVLMDSLPLSHKWKSMAFLFFSGINSTAPTAEQDLRHICSLHHSSRQHRILNPLTPPPTQGPGMEPETSRLLVGFISTVSQRELLDNLVLFLILAEILSAFHHWEWC